VPAAFALALTTLIGCNRPSQPDAEHAATGEQMTIPAPLDATGAQGITAEQDAGIPPGPPGLVSISTADGKIIVAWMGTRDDRIRGYEVYRRCAPGDWETIGFVPIREDDERNRGEYRFAERVRDGCEYTVSAVGADGRPGPRTVDILPRKP
jgi:hypothetical protein